MKIGVDIDETIAASFTPVLNHLNEHSGRGIVFSELTHHNWWEMTHIEPPISKEETQQVFRSFEATYKKHEPISPMEGSIEKIALLNKWGHELVLITGRTEEYAGENTRAWIETYFPDVFSALYFTNNIVGGGRTKSEICKELGIELMIEDHLDFALDLASNGIQVYLLEKPWNRWRTETHPLIHRVKDWEEIPSLF